MVQTALAMTNNTDIRKGERLEEKLKNVYEEISFKKSVVHKGVYPEGPEVYGKALSFFLVRVREVSRCRECRRVPGGLAEP